MGILNTGMRVGIAVTKAMLPRGVKHPDTIINPRMRGLYLTQNKRMSPMGRQFDDPMDLYVVGRPRRAVSPYRAKVTAALYEHPEIRDMAGLMRITGLTREQVVEGLRGIARG